MAVGILLITHEGIGSTLLTVALRLLRSLPLACEAFDVPFDGDPDSLLPQASAAMRRVDSGNGVLVLRVSALSLPMLLRVMNYADLDLDDLPAVAAAGSRNGAITDDA
jgi:PTS system ascorbate-specific IIA component